MVPQSFVLVALKARKVRRRLFGMPSAFGTFLEACCLAWTTRPGRSVQSCLANPGDTKCRSEPNLPQRFMGVKLIPPGLHYVYCSARGGLATVGCTSEIRGGFALSLSRRPRRHWHKPHGLLPLSEAREREKERKSKEEHGKGVSQFAACAEAKGRVGVPLGS